MKKGIGLVLCTFVISSLLFGCTPTEMTTVEESVTEIETEVGTVVELDEPETTTVAKEEVFEITDEHDIIGDLTEAGLPEEAVVFSTAKWNDMGYFSIRAIGYVDAEIDQSRIPEGFPETNQFYGIFFEVKCNEIIDDGVTHVRNGDLGFGGAGVQILNDNLKPRGSVGSSIIFKEVGEVKYLYRLITAPGLEEITQAYFKHSVKNAETGNRDKYVTYITSMPFGSLIINERPEGFDYEIPYSATPAIGEWSENSPKEEVKLRMLGYDMYPLNDDTRPEFMYEDEEVFIFYLEAEYTGSEAISYKNISMNVSGRGVSKIMLWGGYDCTGYGMGLTDKLPLGEKLQPGDKVVFYMAVTARELSSIESISILSDDTQVPLPFH